MFANKTKVYPWAPQEPAQDDFHIRPERVAFKFKLLCAHEMSDRDNLQLSVQLGNLDLKSLKYLMQAFDQACPQ